MDNQEDIVDFQKHVQRPVAVHDGRHRRRHSRPRASRRRCRAKITFAGGTIGGTDGTSLGTFNHENMHQWFGDNVAEAAFNLTFWKEGFATISEYFTTARPAATPPAASARRPATRPSRTA